jgi:hypothetical protein
MKRPLVLSVRVSGLLLGTVSTAEADPAEPFGIHIVTVVQAFPQDPLMPPNPIVPPNPIFPFASLGSYVSWAASTCNAGQYEDPIADCDGLGLGDSGS